MIGLAGNVACQAGAAIAELARRAGLDAVAPQHGDDRLARRHIVFATALREADAKRPVVFEPGRRRRAGSGKIFAMHAPRRPVRRGRGGGFHHPGGAAIVEMRSGLRLVQQRREVEPPGRIAAIVMKHHPALRREQVEFVAERGPFGTPVQ